MSEPGHEAEVTRPRTVFTKWESMREVMGLCVCPACWSAYLRALEAPHEGPPDPVYPIRGPWFAARRLDFF